MSTILTGTPPDLTYLHPRRVPLAQAVSLDEAELGTDGQSDGFGNECEGHCGV